MAKILTALSIKQLKPRKDRDGKLVRREVADGQTKTLYLHVQPSSAKSWVMMVTRPNGQLGKLPLGPVDLTDKIASQTPKLGDTLTLADARTLVAQLHEQRKRGRDVIKDYREEIETERQIRKAKAAEPDSKFSAVAKQFIDEHARPNTRRWKETAHNLGWDYRDDVEPTMTRDGLADRWQDREITTITSDEVYRVVDEAKRYGVPGLERRNDGISDPRGRAMARTLSKFFNWCLQHRKIKASPSVGVYVPPAPKSRERTLTEAELIYFWKATDQISEPFGSVYRLLLLTGCRLREISNMRRSELSEKVVRISIGGKKTEDRGVRMLEIPGNRTKNKKDFLVPLSPFASDIIDKTKKIAGKPGYIFSTNGRTPVSGFSKIKRQLDRLMQQQAKADGVEFKPWRNHDLRRTADTIMNESPPDGLGIPPHVVDAVLNHVSGEGKRGVSGTYNKAKYLPEKLVALQRWSVWVDTLVSDSKARENNVASMDTAREKKKQADAILS
jgi:integrase